MAAELRTKQRLHHAAIRMSIAGSDFAVPSSRPHGKPKYVLSHHCRYALCSLYALYLLYSLRAT